MIGKILIDRTDVVPIHYTSGPAKCLVNVQVISVSYTSLLPEFLHGNFTVIFPLSRRYGR